MQMSTYAEAVKRLQSAIPLVFDALQAGLDASSRQHDEGRLKRSVDPHYFSHTARRIACEHLGSNGLLHTNDNAEGSALRMSGIQVPHNGSILWVFRAASQIPLPTSLRKQQFYRQEATLDGWDNMLLLWDDKAGRLKDPMYLVRPLGGDKRRRSLKVDWSGPVSRSMASLREQDLDLLRPEHESKRLGGDGSA